MPLASELQKVCCLLHLELWTTPHPSGSFSTVGLDLLERSDSLWTLQRQQQQGKRTTFWHRPFSSILIQVEMEDTHRHTPALTHTILLKHSTDSQGDIWYMCTMMAVICVNFARPHLRHKEAKRLRQRNLIAWINSWLFVVFGALISTRSTMAWTRLWIIQYNVLITKISCTLGSGGTSAN